MTTVPAELKKDKKRHWLKLGIELEGGWDDDPKKVALKCMGAQVNHDGSVKGTPANFHGEIVTRPHETVEGLIKDVLAMYPDYINDSCGFHIHASFTPLNTTCLADQAFWTYFLARWEAWGLKNKAPDLFWRRLHGKPTGPEKRVFCAPKFDPGDQLSGKNRKNRYTAINFDAWHKFKTIECRILPMFDSKDMMESSIRELVDIYDTYLSEVGFNPIHLERQVTVDFEGVKSEWVKIIPSREPITHAAQKEFTAPPVGPGITYQYSNAPEALGLMRAFRDNLDTEISL